MRSIMNHDQKLYTNEIKQCQLDFRINFKVQKTSREGFMSLRSKTEELVILNDGEFSLALVGMSSCLTYFFATFCQFHPSQ